MSMNEISSLIKSVSPLLGTAVAGPLGGVVTTLLAGVFGGSSSDINGLVQKMQADPEALVKIKQVEAHIAEINAQKDGRVLDDVKDSRENRSSSVILWIITLSIIWGFLAIMGIIMFLPQEASDIDIIKIMIGYFAGCLTMVVRHWFGGSV